MQAAEDVNYQKQLCRGIVAGIKRYIKETNPVAYQRNHPAKIKG
jgi:hypothetical protein